MRYFDCISVQLKNLLAEPRLDLYQLSCIPKLLEIDSTEFVATYCSCLEQECYRWHGNVSVFQIAVVPQVGKLKSLKELQSKGKLKGAITAGLASQIADGAAAILICNEEGLKKLGVTPRARVVALALAGTDPVTMLGGPIPATRTVLQRSGLTLKDMDLYEVNEAFASVPLSWVKALDADMDKLNVNGGAMALGHPLGGTGCKLMTTLLHELERRGGRYGLQAICEGGGTANATIIERIGVPAKL
eukprot:m.893730 g.893730  ORF g.893730 m.893730 type:complete len:246 (+) comp23663_c0_seq2:909-1646(+)